MCNIKFFEIVIKVYETWGIILIPYNIVSNKNLSFKSLYVIKNSNQISQLSKKFNAQCPTKNMI